MKRVYVNLTDEHAAALKQRASDTGVLVAEQIRRAIAAALDEPKETKRPTTQPVLFAARETR